MTLSDLERSNSRSFRFQSIMHVPDNVAELGHMLILKKSAENCHTNCKCQAECQGPCTSFFFTYFPYIVWHHYWKWVYNIKLNTLDPIILGPVPGLRTYLLKRNCMYNRINRSVTYTTRGNAFLPRPIAPEIIAKRMKFNVVCYII